MEREVEKSVLKLCEIDPCAAEVTAHNVEFLKGHEQAAQDRDIAKDQYKHAAGGISVQDDGAGGDPQKMEAAMREGCGAGIFYGLRNIYERLRLKYGCAFSFRFESCAGIGKIATVSIFLDDTAI